MTIKIQNITNETIQRHTISTDAKDVILRLYFLPTVESWFMDVSYGSKTVKGVRLIVGAYHIASANFPCDFIVEDALKFGVDPFHADDFSSDRCRLYMLEAADMVALRGQPVPL